MSDGFFIGDIDDGVRISDTVQLLGAEAHHAAVVRRIGVGETVTITNGYGLGVIGPVVKIEREKVTVEVLDVEHSERLEPQITVVQALPKNDRAELAVDLMTEAGVTTIVPWEAIRSIGSWRGERGEKGQVKWENAAREAAKQARRYWVPTIEPLATTLHVAKLLSEATLGVICHEKATERIALCPVPEQGHIVVVIGPEGGLTGGEVATFEATGAGTYLLGPTVLRTSTAGATVVTQLRLLADLASMA